MCREAIVMEQDLTTIFLPSNTIREVEISFNEERQFALLTWLKHATGGSYKKIMNLTLEHLKRVEYNTLIIDGSKFGALIAEDQDWTIENFIPNLISIDIKTLCIITPKDIFGEVSIKMIIQSVLDDPNLKDKIKLNYKFDSVTAASNWLKLMNLTKKK